MPDGFVRFNRDDIREMLLPGHNARWYLAPDLKKKETGISAAFDVLKARFNLIWDDNTNLNWHMLKDDIISLLAQNWDIKVIFLTDSEDFELCVERDLNRKRTVGKEVLEKFYKKYFNVKQNIEIFKKEIKIEIVFV